MERQALRFEIKAQRTDCFEDLNGGVQSALPALPGWWAAVHTGVLMSKLKMTVAKYIEQQLALCDRPQKDVAKDCGYENANVITMFKSGTTKVPLAKVPLLAKALGVDVIYMFRLVMQEYQPESWTVIESIFGTDMFISANELAMARFVVSCTGGSGIDLENEDNAVQLLAVIESLSQSDFEKAEAAVAAQNRLPSNARHKD